MKNKSATGTDAAEYLTPGEVAEILHVHKKTVMRRFANYPGVVDLAAPTPKRETHRRLMRIPRVVLTKFLYEHRVR
jgi:hypothetical protein